MNGIRIRATKELPDNGVTYTPELKAQLEKQLRIAAGLALINFRSRTNIEHLKLKDDVY